MQWYTTKGEFGMNYGFLMKENKLLSRGVVVVGKDSVRSLKSK